MYKYLVIIFVFIGAQLLAQSSQKYNSEYANFYRAEELFQKEQYGAARNEFTAYMNQFGRKNDAMYQKALYYEGLSALELFHNDAVKLLQDFNQNYPESIYKAAIFFRLGQYFCQKKDYKEALIWLNQLRADEVEADNRQEYYFKLGYANFQEERFVEARSAFHEIKDGNSQYTGPALYYYSHIAYQDKSYQTALDGFLKLQTSERFSKIAPYYIVQIYHLQGRYDEVIKYAPSALDSSNLVNSNDINHLLGDAYYRSKKYDEAIPYLAEYNKKTKTTRDDDYELGFSYFRAGMYIEAVKILDKVAQVKDSLGQTAYYHIGEAYLNEKKLSPARAAFEAASKIQADAAIQEDALFNYAVLSYKLDINPYDEAVEALQHYLKHYPNSKRKEDVYQYLVNVYTSTNNYEKALISLDKLTNKDIRLKSAYQLVAFNRGVELYQKAAYKEAINSFELVSKYKIDAGISGKAEYWSADAHYQLKQYAKAIQGYRAFLNLPATLSPDLKCDAYYNIGYAYYNQKDTLLGIEAFRIYTQQSNLKNKQKLADAYLRAADGSYATKQNENAIKFYSEALKLKAGYEDRALFYLAKTYGYTEGGTAKKILHLQDLVNNYSSSKYVVTAIIELAVTYKGIEEYEKAKRYFEQIINDYPASIFVKNAYIEIADIYFKKQEYPKCELAYRQVLSDYGSDRAICEKGSRGLIALFDALKQPEKAIEVGERYPCSGMTKDQQEELFYSPAKRTYDDTLQPVSAAISQFEKYLSKYPAGVYVNDATNYLADCYYRAGDFEKSIALYIETLQTADNNFTETAAIRVSKYLFNSKKYKEAIPYYERLEKVGSTPYIIFNSRLGLMRSYFLVENWENGAIFSKLVLENKDINSTIRLEAEYASAFSNYNLKRYAAAKPSLEWLVKNTTTKVGAEAKYLLAEMYFQLKEVEKTDAELKGLLKMKPQYDFWVAKGLILQAKILIQKDDLFQAEVTLNSVIENYPIKEDGILFEATEVWNEMKKLKNREKEIAPKTETVIEVNEGTDEK
jgi:tetratricopeptide (TPR) repeat protein